MYLLIILLPLIAALGALGFGFKLGRYGVSFMTVSLAGLNSVIAVFIFYEVALCGSFCFCSFANWFNVGYCIIEWGGYFDSVTAVMLLVITSISFFVHLYSIDYMANDPHLIRFMAFLSLFTFFMILLVVSPNLIQLFVGWEGVGLCSYLLINFWHTRLQANKAAIKAVLINRIGDIGILLAILYLFVLFKSVDFSVLFAVSILSFFDPIFFFGLPLDNMELVTLFLFFGAMGKSAQLGLHTWLPDAMEGPTPVSALIHAATMVTAGVFLIVRFSPLFELAPFTLLVVTTVGALTALFGATTALFQNDIKKIIAYSTCSQLGYMFLICGLSHYSVGMYHLFNHAFFKALLFLGSGAIIHTMNDEQDLRRLGGLRRVLPFSYAVMLIGSLSLIGFPFLTGFYSKDVILEIAFMRFSFISHFGFWMGVISAFFTACYSMKLLYFVFFSSTNAYYRVIKHAHEVPVFIFIPLVCLVIGSVFFGYFFREMFIGVGTIFWQNSIFMYHGYSVFHDYEFLSCFIKFVPLGTISVGFYLAYIACERFDSKQFQYQFSNYRAIYVFFNRKWFFDKLQNELLGQVFLVICLKQLYFNFDKGFLEFFGPEGIRRQVIKLSYLLQQTGGAVVLSYYFFLMLCGFILLCSIFFFFQFLIIYLILSYFFFVSPYRSVDRGRC